MRNRLVLWRQNSKFVRSIWGNLDQRATRQLRYLTINYQLAVGTGDVQLLNNRWYVTHAGLLGIAKRRKCSGIKTWIISSLSDPASHRWVVRATVYRSRRSRGFVGYGDADPSNVSSLVHGAEMRVAETRAVNRALRKAYGIGLCSVEELGSYSGPVNSSPAVAQLNGPDGKNGSSNGGPSLRDRLCLLFRQYNLDPNLVKAYAADFCGTQTLKEASRDRIESFISQLAAAAKNDRDALVCKLNSYAQPTEVKP